MKFSELDLHPALLGALAARGYETASSVQTAVLGPGHAGRDLLVSSQTGSGKTIAFGAAVVETLLGVPGGASASAAAEPVAPSSATMASASASESVQAPRAKAFAPGGKRPGALVVVPTRELAVQVREELGWFLAQTRLRLGSFTGGTAVSGDLRALERGVDIAIGTPGRLVDLVARARLDLSGLRVVVLDEADEMLDLGFREDLEKLLEASPRERRTLMLSATLPSEIRSMARKYQRDALAIDPRKDSGESATSPHADIHYVAHLIHARDRLATVVNVLRARAPKRAIVFCTTRDAVSLLHTALMARGFTATAISGERAQTDRDRALALIRTGQAQVLVATNVAARGLHLPDVELIVHADLPLNAESLTHRSGRTGRAGRKGTAVVIATLTERRKAERLMSIAHVVAPWTAAPTPESITAAARERLLASLLRDAAGPGPASALEEPVDGQTEEATDAAAEAAAMSPDVEPLLARLEAAAMPLRDILGRLLGRELERLPRGEPVHGVVVPSDGRDARGRALEERAAGERFDARSSVMFRVNMGMKDKADPKWILPLVCRRGGVTRRDVGAIRVGPHETTFEISAEAAADFARSAAETDPRAPQVRIERVGFAPPRAPRFEPARPNGAGRPTRSSDRAPLGGGVGREAGASAAPKSSVVRFAAVDDGSAAPLAPAKKEVKKAARRGSDHEAAVAPPRVEVDEPLVGEASAAAPPRAPSPIPTLPSPAIARLVEQLAPAGPASVPAPAASGPVIERKTTRLRRPAAGDGFVSHASKEPAARLGPVSAKARATHPKHRLHGGSSFSSPPSSQLSSQFSAPASPPARNAKSATPGGGFGPPRRFAPSGFPERGAAAWNGGTTTPSTATRSSGSPSRSGPPRSQDTSGGSLSLADGSGSRGREGARASTLGPARFGHPLPKGGFDRPRGRAGGGAVGHAGRSTGAKPKAGPMRGPRK